MLTEDVCRIGRSSNVEEPADPCSDRRAHLVEGERCVTLVQLAVRHGCGVDDRLVVAEHAQALQDSGVSILSLS